MTERCRSPASCGQAAPPEAARVISREPDRIVIAPPGPGRLVVADLVYPGWKVRIDGKPAPALAAATCAPSRCRRERGG